VVFCLLSEYLAESVGRSRESFDHSRRMVGRYHENGVPGYDGALDRGKGGEMENERSGDWIQGFIRCT